MWISQFRGLSMDEYVLDNLVGITKEAFCYSKIEFIQSTILLHRVSRYSVILITPIWNDLKLNKQLMYDIDLSVIAA